jgi:PadR family transcriptional regulator PadR
MQYSFRDDEVNALSSSQILKGILEGCLLSIISKGEIYGYEMIEKLSTYGFTMVSEGSIYPLLIRMRKEGLVTTRSKKLPSGGPKRKYYSLTEQGKEELDSFKQKWRVISKSVNQLMEDE